MGNGKDESERNKRELENSIVPDVENMDEILKSENEIRMELLEAFDKVEADYRTGKVAYDGYTRSAFYNEQRINMEFTIGEIEFVSLNEISSGELYDSKGRKLESYQDIDLGGEKLAEDGLMETGKSYMIRVRDNSGLETRNLYYLVKIANDGVGELRWICFTKNEQIPKDLLEDGDIDLELTENGGYPNE